MQFGTSKTAGARDDLAMTPPPRSRKSGEESLPPVRKNPPEEPSAEKVPADEHEGATDEQVGDTTGPGVGYDQEPEQESDEGGVGVS